MERLSRVGLSVIPLQTDVVGQGLFVILVCDVSTVSWALIVTKGVALFQRQRRSKAFLNSFGTHIFGKFRMKSLTHGVTRRFAHLTSHTIASPPCPFGAAKLEGWVCPEFLTRTIKRCWTKTPYAWKAG